MTAGRVVIIDNQRHKNVLGIVLNSSLGKNNDRNFTCLVICDKNKPENEVSQSAKGEKTDNLVVPVRKTSLFLPEGPCWHDLVQCKSGDISVITAKTIKVESDKIIDNIKKRQMPRFK